jgi:acetolactate synthase-1/2/3 large subunit
MEALPDFIKLAESFGHEGIRVEHTSDVREALREGLSRKDKLVLMDFVTDQNENVYPMIAAGKGHHEMHLTPERELA